MQVRWGRLQNEQTKLEKPFGSAILPNGCTLTPMSSLDTIDAVLNCTEPIDEAVPVATR
jgi:hypothetical protein